MYITTCPAVNIVHRYNNSINTVASAAMLLQSIVKAKLLTDVLLLLSYLFAIGFQHVLSRRRRSTAGMKRRIGLQEMQSALLILIHPSIPTSTAITMHEFNAGYYYTLRYEV